MKGKMKIDKGSYIDERVCLINPSLLRPSFLSTKLLPSRSYLSSRHSMFGLRRTNVLSSQSNIVSSQSLMGFVAKPHEFVTKPHEFVAKPHEFVTKPHEFVTRPHEFVTKQHSFLTKKLGFLEKHLQTSAPRSGSRI